MGREIEREIGGGKERERGTGERREVKKDSGLVLSWPVANWDGTYRVVFAH